MASKFHITKGLKKRCVKNSFSTIYNEYSEVSFMEITYGNK